ncbi:MAG: hypothetical protein AAGI54_10900 [Planctomycetota bacterium]
MRATHLFRAAIACVVVNNVTGIAPAEAPSTRPATPQGPFELVDEVSPDVASQGGAIEAVDEAEPALPEVRVRVQGVNYNESIQFDENGQERHRHRNFNVQLRVHVDGAEDLVSYGGVEVSSALTSAGERLTAPNQHHRHGRHPIMQRQRFGGGGHEFHASFQLSVPNLSADAIEELRGTVKLLMARGEVKQAALIPIQLYDGRPVRVVGIEGVRVTVKRMEQQGMVRVEFPVSGPPLEGATFLDEHRQAIPTPQSRGGGTTNDRAYQDFGLRLPDDGGVLLRWRGEVEEVEVPFVVTDVPLPGQRGGGVELSVVARPVGDGDPLAGLELLEVEFVEEPVEAN